LEAPLLSVYAAVVFLAAVIIGLIMGGLMFLHGGRWRQRSRAAQADRLTGGGARLVCLLAPPHTPNQVLTSVMASAIRTGR
jgi:hypothetical protein